MMVKSIVFAGCKDTTYECMKAVLGMGRKIDLLITLSPESGKVNNVAGYQELSEFARKNRIDTYHCQSYSLTSKVDIRKLQAVKIKVLLVIGWQRLIPQWMLDRLTIGAFGMHGSSQALPYGRGRSPMNWSLIQGKEMFVTNLIKYTKDVDAGDIVDTEIFDLNAFDSAKTCHYKNTLAMIKILKRNLDNILLGKLRLKKQLPIRPTYFPKRTAEDGVIFWERGMTEIYNLIRAVTRPFPGAFTFYKKTKIMIWEAHPFDSRLFDPYIMPGTILHVFQNGDFIVKTADGSLIVNDYEGIKPERIKPGQRLDAGNYKYKNPYEVPALQ